MSAIKEVVALQKIDLQLQDIESLLGDLPKKVEALVNEENEILLGKRPNDVIFSDFWEFPGGKIKKDETPEQAIIRETKEEAGAELIIKPDSLYTLFNLPTINQVYIFFRAELANLNFSAGVESEEVELYQEKEIPWSEIAFPVVKTTIKQYFEDTRSGHFPVRMFNVRHHEDRTVSTELISCNEVQSSDHS